MRMQVCLGLFAVALFGPLAQAQNGWNIDTNKGPVSEVVKIGPADNPMQMATVKRWLATDAVERVNGQWPFTPPAGDPSKVAKDDYINAVTNYPGLTYFADRYGKGPIKAEAGGMEAMPVFIAMYKHTGDRQYLDMAIHCIRMYCLATDEEVAQNPTNPPPGQVYSAYWKWEYAFILIPLLQVQDTPEYAEMTKLLGRSLGARANAWPLPPFRGAYNMAFDAAFWYDMALKFNPDIPRAKELKAYADDIWASWDRIWDTAEDDPNYTTSDMIVLHAWALLRGEKWWKDRRKVTMWRDYAEQVSNDGSWPAYGDGGNVGRYFMGLMIAEMSATCFKDGHYKWLAHRAFWNGVERQPKLCAGSGYMNLVYAAMAYLFADDSIKEVAPKAGITLTERHWRELRSAESRAANPGLDWFHTQDRLVPSKLMFRAGSGATDDYLFVQAAQQGGHGHMDAGAIAEYGGDLAYYLNYATLRLDNYMEAHNLVVLRDPAKPDTYWPKGGPHGYMCTEDVTVPVKGSASDASYARIHIQEYPGQPATTGLWHTVQNWKSNWNLEKAIGYKNWPVRSDRSILFVNDRFTVVRDVISPTIPVAAILGPNWTFGELGSAGAHWVNVWMPKTLNGWFGSMTRYSDGTWHRMAPVTTAPRDVLIWFAPRADATLQMEKLLRDRSGYDCYVPLNSDFSLPLRAWYTRTGDWQPGQPQAFTSVLMPHAPQADAAKLANSITVVQDTPDCTAIRVKTDSTDMLIVMNVAGRAAVCGPVETDAEATLVTYVNGKPAHLSAWNATRVVLGGKKILASRRTRNLDRNLK